MLNRIVKSSDNFEVNEQIKGCLIGFTGDLGNTWFKITEVQIIGDLTRIYIKSV